MYPSTIPPIRFGIKNTVRKTLVPLNPFVRARAIKNASTLIRILETKANITVSQNEWLKVLSKSSLE